MAGTPWPLARLAASPNGPAPPTPATPVGDAGTATPPWRASRLWPWCPLRCALPQVFNSLNVLELKSLEEPRYLMQQFARHPIACLTLAWYAVANAGERPGRVGRGVPSPLERSRWAAGQRGYSALASCCDGWRVMPATGVAQRKGRRSLEVREARGGWCGARARAGDIARKHIQDPALLRFIDLECYIWSTVNADMTPHINAGMVRGGAAWAAVVQGLLLRALHGAQNRARTIARGDLCRC